MTRIVFDGNHGLVTRRLKDDYTAFLGEPKKWEGLASVSITFKQPQTVVPSDDDPEWKAVNGVPSGTGTIVLRSINIHQYNHFIACIAEAGQGVRFGEDLPVVPFAFSVNENVSDGSELKHIFYKCRATNIPSFDSTTRTNEAPVTRDIEIPIALSPLFYTKSDGRRDRVIYDILSSEADAARFNENTDTIIFPTELVV